MRILTVRQPWAWAIIHGGKDVENRSRNLAGSYRGPVAIHVAQVEDANAFSLSPCRDALNTVADRDGSVDWWDNYGRIIGVVDLVDAHNGYCDTDDFPICSEWAEFGQWHLELANPRALAEPIPYRGALGLRRFNETVDAEILRQLAEVS